MGGEKRIRDGVDGEYEDDKRDALKIVHEIVNKVVNEAILNVVHEIANEVALKTVRKNVNKVALSTVHEAVNEAALNSMHYPKQRPCTSTRASKKHDISRAFVQGS